MTSRLTSVQKIQPSLWIKSTAAASFKLLIITEEFGRGSVASMMRTSFRLAKSKNGDPRKKL